ncbi:MAG: PepSY domain-containing protein [Paracoccaceae bacterium]
MLKIGLIAGLLGSSLLAGMALAKDDECNVPMSQWLPREAVAKKAREMGWKVDRVRTDDGCYKVYGRDAKGDRIEAEFNPATLELIEIESKDGDAQEHEDEGENEAEGGGGGGMLVNPTAPFAEKE